MIEVGKGKGMGRYIIISFAFIAWAFYEMSGGADFAQQVVEETQAPEAVEDTVTRGSLNLATADEILIEEEPTLQLRSPLLKPRIEGQDTSAEPLEVSTLPSLADAGAEIEISLAEPTPDEDPALVEDPTPAENLASEQEASVEQEEDYRFVIGTLVNMRAGPGTGYDVIAQLEQGARVVILEDLGAGWVRLDADGVQGWMADFLLTTPQ